MKYLVTCWFWFVFLVTAPVCVVLGASLWLVSLPFDRNRALLHAFVSRWCHYLYLRAMPGWRVRVEGRERLPPGPVIIVSNHQSAADILCAMGLFHPFKFVAKASLFNVPMVGWLMRLMEYVPVVRGHAHAMDQMLADCRGWLRRGVPVLIYPEGTYAPTRQPMPFKRGAFRLAIEEQVPVVPVLLEGTTDVVAGDGPWMGPRASVRVRVLPPLPVESLGSDDVALAERVRALYFEALGLPPLPQASTDERKSECA
ncbi:lysophospholipid acyltransferase family protein [Hyalangium rubrum]|uniref:Lysophospholipid acyltransferase family protein n=1 Tax=Hyalangium rubrum TaxID=3103134 RepID=A0ABU5HIT7_9BACT|nr:lysophospholipid acyltransferase family protein [Hyalangium sp. s54d21]MDY7232753.1 lysophospholipid acyltransferase family protein [Hyalangium sp. s54d21]